MPVERRLWVFFFMWWQARGKTMYGRWLDVWLLLARVVDECLLRFFLTFREREHVRERDSFFFLCEMESGGGGIFFLCFLGECGKMIFGLFYSFDFFVSFHKILPLFFPAHILDLYFNMFFTWRQSKPKSTTIFQESIFTTHLFFLLRRNNFKAKQRNMNHRIKKMGCRPFD